MAMTRGRSATSNAHPLRHAQLAVAVDLSIEVNGETPQVYFWLWIMPPENTFSAFRWSVRLLAHNIEANGEILPFLFFPLTARPWYKSELLSGQAARQ